MTTALQAANLNPLASLPSPAKELLNSTQSMDNSPEILTWKAYRSSDYAFAAEIAKEATDDDMAQLEASIAAHERSLKPMAPEQAVKVVEALAVLRALTCCRPGSRDDAKLQCFAYERKLAAFPIKAVLAVLDAWPLHNQWFPTWFELQDALDKRIWPVRSRLKCLLEIQQDWQAAKKENSNAD